MGWTNEQKQAIEKEGANILVSAAAGSGKTSVLVARIINKVVNEKIDIDKLLVVTFTNAAASEMKQRLLNAIYEKIDENPSDSNLQRQISLINRAHISTIHSFCLDIIRNNFFELGISPNFRVGDPTEIEIMKQEAIEKVFEDKYENKDEEFLKLLDLYTTYKDDQPLKDTILKIFEFISSVPFPEKWLNEEIEDFNINVEEFGQTKWGKLILENVNDTLKECLTNLQNAKKMTEVSENLMDFSSVIVSDINDLKDIELDKWDKTYNQVTSKVWTPWPRKTKLDEEEKEIKEKAKQIRDEVKDIYTKKIGKILISDSKQSINDIKEMYPVLRELGNLVLEFVKEFAKRKSEKNILDFSDIEHTALKLLLDKDGAKTEIAKKYDFNEILIDEYQDSNLVQEKILTSVSNGKNIFMVGDVKQSIYRFRQARPDLFLTKYDTYSKIDENKVEENFENIDKKTIENNTKIQLYKNFRSRREILDITNQIFQSIMSKKLGEIDYEQEEYLNYAANYEEPRFDCKTEMYVIDNKEKEIDENIESADDNDANSKELVENSVLEARLVAKKIKELKDKGVSYKEIAILLRSPSTIASVIEKELTEENIPVFSDTSSEYLESIEIDTILSLLKIIDNPLQDIPLVTVLRSPIGGFTDNELIEIRLKKQNAPFFKSLEEAQKDEKNDKAKTFIKKLEMFKKMQNELPLDELIWNIYSETGYYHYVRLMPNGKLRQANLRKLFEKAKEYEKISFKGLFNFITFIEKVATKSSNMTAAKIIGENDDVVRIMSIHKSKGLEFPIVFVCGVGKKFNLKDMNDRIVYDQDLGLGVNYIKNGIEYSTLTKEAIKIKMRKESISEEMRVLYVALTRAKEKLIIIGTDKDAEKSLKDKETEIEKYHGKDRMSKINSKLVEKFTRYLDWIELVYKYNPQTDMSIEIVNKDQLTQNEKIIEDEKKDIEYILKNQKEDTEKYKNVEELLTWKYRNENDIEAPSKTSVTAIKQLYESKLNEKSKNDEMEEKSKEEKSKEKKLNEKNSERKKLDLNNKNEKENENISASRKGTLIHLALQKLEDDNIDLMLEKLNLNENEKRELMKEKQIFENYINSDLYKELKEAKEINKETPFYMEMSLEEIKNVLVQGVIDLYYISKNDELVLIDYKTDRNVTEEQLIEKYKIQLDLYKQALERALKRKVDKKYIYSTYLNKEIEL